MKTYLCQVQFDGSPFHGWQKQKDLPTVQLHFETILHSLLGEKFKKIIGGSRTDAGVHALNYFFLLFSLDELTNEEVNKIEEFKDASVSFKKVSPVDRKFRIINDVAFKEYLYLFYPNQPNSYKNALGFEEVLDMEQMKAACENLVGEHWFGNFQYRGSERKQYVRTIHATSIDNIDPRDFNLPAGELYGFRVRAAGFLRGQVRIMMGALLNVGQGLCSVDDFKLSLKAGSEKRVGFMAPACGLHLMKVQFNNLF